MMKQIRRSPIRNSLVAIGSLIVALALTVMPVPGWLQHLEPPWVLLVMIYWLLSISAPVGLGVAWCLGIILDVLDGSLLGQHAFAMALVTYIAMKFYQEFRQHIEWQQLGTIFLLTMMYQFIVYVIQVVIGQGVTDYFYWFAPLVAVLVWPVLVWLLAKVR